MKFKIDTKEKLSVLTPEEPVLSANLAVELGEMLHSRQSASPGDIIIDLCKVSEISPEASGILIAIQDEICGQGHSCIFTRLQQGAMEADQKKKLNYAPTLTEAVDLVIMEALERELMAEDGEPE